MLEAPATMVMTMAAETAASITKSEGRRRPRRFSEGKAKFDTNSSPIVGDGTNAKRIGMSVIQPCRRICSTMTSACT